MATNHAVYSVPEDVQRKAVELYAETGSYSEVARRLDLDYPEQARRILKSPQGSFALEQLLRERARARAIRLGAITERYIDELETSLRTGNERIVGGRRDGDPLTVFLRPNITDVVQALAWLTHHQREVAESLATVDVTTHDVSNEARAQNLAILRDLVAQEERRIANADAGVNSLLGPASTDGTVVHGPTPLQPGSAAVAPLLQKGASSSGTAVGNLLPATPSHGSTTHPPGRGEGPPKNSADSGKVATGTPQVQAFDRPVEVGVKRSPGARDVDGAPRGMIREASESEVGWDDLA